MYIWYHVILVSGGSKRGSFKVAWSVLGRVGLSLARKYHASNKNHLLTNVSKALQSLTILTKPIFAEAICNFIKKETGADIFKDIFFTKNLWVTATGDADLSFDIKNWISRIYIVCRKVNPPFINKPLHYWLPTLSFRIF